MTQNILIDVANTRYNNLNIIRFIAAIMVIICHSIPICMGEFEEDFIGDITYGMLNLGGIAVGVFFVTGGYLIAQSSENKKYARNFFKARITKIFPSLFVMVIICTFLLGPCLTSFNIVEYFTNLKTYKYLLNALLVPVHSLPGVFYNNIYPNVVNGSLWTLPIEFLCYIGCFFAYKLNFFDPGKYKVTIPLVGMISIIFLVIFHNNIVLVRVIRPIILYYIGIGFYVFRDKIKISMRYGVIFALLYVGAIVLNLPNIGMLLFFPYLVYFLVYGFRGKLCEFGVKHEISYGMYLWGWPVQQVLFSIGGVCRIWYFNAIVTTVIVIILGWINNVLVENNNWFKRRNT